MRCCCTESVSFAVASSGAAEHVTGADAQARQLSPVVMHGKIRVIRPAAEVFRRGLI